MEMVKKYWWIIAIIIILIYLYYVSTSEKKEDPNCKKIGWDEWYRRKENLKNTLGSWDLAHQAMLEAGYCEHLG